MELLLPKQRKSLSIEFPTSSDPPGSSPREEIIHPAHTQHPLFEVTLQDLFTCNGCKEQGAGRRLSCQQCDYQLHDFCSFSPPFLNSHPLHAQHQLAFHFKPKSGGIFWPRCDICDKATKGFVFRCSACHFQMHPCCAMLSDEMNFPVHQHKLKLQPPLPSDYSCGECNRERSGRMYRCTTACDYHLHAVCAKDMINGLEANGIKKSGKHSMLGPTARFASQIVIHFIGGLLEGVGQTVGQVLVQDIARGRCISARGRRTDHD